MNAKRVGGLVCALILVVVVIAALRRGALTPTKPEAITESPDLTAKHLQSESAKQGPSDPERRRRTLDRLREFVTALRNHQKGITEAWEGRTDEEKARRLEELNQLRFEAGRLQIELEERAAELDPQTLLEFLKTPDGAFARMRLAAAIAAAAELEITSEESPGGPLLKGLLPLARGTVQDKLFLLTVARDMRLVNREIGDVCFKALADTNWKTRDPALQALCEQASRGNLKETITRNAPTLQKLALESSDQTNQVKLSAFQSLTVVETPEMDEFLVRQVEASAEPGLMYQRAEILIESAPRILRAQHHRMAPLMKAAMDQPSDRPHHFQIVRVSAHFPWNAGVEILRYLAGRLHTRDGKSAEGLDYIIRKIEQGQAAELLAEMDKLQGHEREWSFLQAIGVPKSARRPPVYRPQ